MASISLTTDATKSSTQLGQIEDEEDEEGEEIGEKEGQYFVDQATGQYYFQTSDGETMTVVSAPGVEEQAGPSKTPPSKATDGSNQVMMSTGSSSDQYQTVTIVPSDGDTGEVSYVLIVQQPGDEKSGGGKSGTGTEGVGGPDDVYDFDGDPDATDALDFITDDKKLKGTGKRSQTVTQAHMCNYCNYTTPKRYLLSRHMKSHSEERPHKCSVCERGFKTLASLQNHVNTHTGTKPHRCKFCQSCFTTSGELVRHVRYRHTFEKPHKCHECDYASVELSKLKRHIRCHTGERPYQCSHCTYASPDTFKLKRHMRIHTGEKPYKCDICTARFTQSNSLKAHRLIHTGDKPVFQCELCPTTCGRKTDLRLHVQKLHTAVQPVHCKMCGKAFPDRYTLKVHKKTHEGERCFKCDLCPYSSISQRHLESHMLIHTDQKPFECDQCDQSFRQRQLLKRHQNLYHNPNYVPPEPKEKTHECPECARSFRHKGNLIRHMALHDPDSTAKEKAIALKVGRAKRIQIIDGQQVEVLGEEDEEDMEEFEDDNIIMDEGVIGNDQSGSGNVMAVQTADGQQQYIVLEITHLNEGEEAIHQENKVQRVLRSSAATAVTLDVPVTESEAPATMGVLKTEPLAGQLSEKQAFKSESIASSRPKRKATKNEGVVGKKSPAPMPSADEDTGARERGKRRTRNDSKGDLESPNKKADMANCFGFESDEDD